MNTVSDFTIIPKKEKSGRPSKRPTLAQLKKDYAKMTVKEVAKKYEVSESTVRTWVFRARRGKY